MDINQLPDSAQYILGTIAAVLLVLAFIPYSVAVIKKDITPRPLTWIGWTLLIGISLFSSIVEKGFELNQIAMCMSTAGCLVISILSVKNGNIKTKDWVCLMLGIVCAVIYMFTKDAWLTTILAIVADILVAIPTLHNAWLNPKDEKSSAWTFGSVAYLITLIACVGHPWLYAAFPIYLFCFNSTMIFLTSRKKVLINPETRIY